VANITLADLTSEQTTVELGEHSYRVLTLTRSVQKKLEKAQPAIDGLDQEQDSDKAVTTMADAIDALLAPENGAPPAKKVLVDAWKADGLSVSQLGLLFERVQGASVARPT
jgi:hypothetical protein